MNNIDLFQLSDFLVWAVPVLCIVSNLIGFLTARKYKSDYEVLDSDAKALVHYMEMLIRAMPVYDEKLDAFTLNCADDFAEKWVSTAKGMKPPRPEIRQTMDNLTKIMEIKLAEVRRATVQMEKMNKGDRK